MTESGHEIHCPHCGRFCGLATEPALVTGTVKHVPHVSAAGGCGYSQCVSCRTFVRWEVIPPNIQASSERRAAA